MRVKLTRAFVAKAAAAPNHKRSIYWDASLQGFGLDVTASGHRSFVVQYRSGGVSRRLTIRADLGLDAARKQARKLLGRVAMGGDPLTERRKQQAAAENTFHAIALEYFKREGSKLRTREWREQIFKRLIFPMLGHRQISDIKRSDIVRLLDTIESENGPVMADRTRALVSRVLNWHATRADEFRSPIVRGMARTSSKERARSRVLGDFELRIVWQATGSMGGPFGALVRFLLLTGVRRGEAAGMRWDEIAGGVWTVPAARCKTKTEHHVPLSDAAQALLAGLPRLDQRKDALLFTSGGQRPLSDFAHFKRKLDGHTLALLREQDAEAQPLPNWTLHDLRRTARSLLSRAGVRPDIAERVLGHVIPGVGGVYDRHSYEREKQQALEALAALIERIVAGAPDNVVTLSRGQG